MTKLDKLIELNSLEKQNRRNRLEDKLKQEEFYGEIKELFDPVTTNLNVNSEALLANLQSSFTDSEAMQVLQNQTLAALEDNTNTLRRVEHQRQRRRQSSFLNKQASLLSPTLNPPVTLKDDRGKTFTVGNDMIEILLLMVNQTNKQFELISVDPNSNKFKINGVDVSLVPDGIKMKGKVYDFSKGFAIIITNKDVTERDIKGDESKIKQFLRDIGYKQRGDTKSNRSKLLRGKFASIGEATSHVLSIPTSSEDEIYLRDTSDYEQGIVEEEEEGEEETDIETDKQMQASGLTKTDPNNLVERLELLILETKAGHDGLYDEMLDISKQLLSTNIINQEQLDNFVFNYGK